MITEEQKMFHTKEQLRRFYHDDLVEKVLYLEEVIYEQKKLIKEQKNEIERLRKDSNL